jgi:hypothetical protein
LLKPEDEAVIVELGLAGFGERFNEMEPEQDGRVVVELGGVEVTTKV